MSLIAFLCSLPVALVGAYYLVNAGAVAWMGPLEGEKANVIRMRLRRANAAVMLLMSLALYLGISRAFGLEPGRRVGLVAPVAWLATFPLLLLMLIFAWLDMRLTRKLRRELLRKALKMNDRDPTSSDSTRSNFGKTPAVALVAAVLLCGTSSSCDNTSAQPPAGGNTAQRAPATRPATRPTTMRSEDGPRPREGEPQHLRTVQMQLGDQMFILQVADTDEERTHGLMFVKSLAPDEGMIFIYPSDRWLSFWMKNTFIPLDIAFVNADGVVVNVAQMVPHDLEGTDSTGPAKYAIELPLNAARRIGLEPGMRLQFPESARDSHNEETD